MAQARRLASPLRAATSETLIGLLAASGAKHRGGHQLDHLAVRQGAEVRFYKIAHTNDAQSPRAQVCGRPGLSQSVPPSSTLRIVTWKDMPRWPRSVRRINRPRGADHPPTFGCSGDNRC